MHSAQIHSVVLSDLKQWLGQAIFLGDNQFLNNLRFFFFCVSREHFSGTIISKTFMSWNCISVKTCQWCFFFLFNCLSVQVKSQLSKASQPVLTSVSVEWQQFDNHAAKPIQAPNQITSLFSGSRQVVYGYVPFCTQVGHIESASIIEDTHNNIHVSFLFNLTRKQVLS